MAASRALITMLLRAHRAGGGKTIQAANRNKGGRTITRTPPNPVVTGTARRAANRSSNVFSTGQKTPKNKNTGPTFRGDIGVRRWEQARSDRITRDYDWGRIDYPTWVGRLVRDQQGIVGRSARDATQRMRYNKDPNYLKSSQPPRTPRPGNRRTTVSKFKDELRNQFKWVIPRRKR